MKLLLKFRNNCFGFAFLGIYKLELHNVCEVFTYATIIYAVLGFCRVLLCTERYQTKNVLYLPVSSTGYLLKN